MTPEAPGIGTIVHVRGAEGICSPAIVMADLGGLLRLRVLYRAPVTEPVGSRDVEGSYPAEWDRTTVSNPDGTRRVLDSWHLAHL